MKNSSVQNQEIDSRRSGMSVRLTYWRFGSMQLNWQVIRHLRAPLYFQPATPKLRKLIAKGMAHLFKTTYSSAGKLGILRLH